VRFKAILVSYVGLGLMPVDSIKTKEEGYDLDQPYKNPIITVMLSYIRKETYSEALREVRDNYKDPFLRSNEESQEQER
jgi:hypothetical protein